MSIESFNLLLPAFLAVLFSLAASAAFWHVERAAPKLQEAIIESCFVVAASLAILLVAMIRMEGRRSGPYSSAQSLYAALEFYLLVWAFFS